MSLWRQLAHGFRTFTDRATVEAELDDEVRDYFERARADLVRQGFTPAEAARAVRRELGDLAKARHALRSYGWENTVDAMLGDLRQSWRRLRQTPSFAAVAALTLALGIGVNVALFSLFQQILLDPLPVAEPERLVNLTDPGPDLAFLCRDCGGIAFGSVTGGPDSLFSYPMFRDLERGQEPFAGIAAHRIFDANLSAGEDARRDTGFFVSGSYFSVLGLKPALGRLLDSADDRVAGEAEAVVLSHAYWQRELGGDPAVLERRLVVNGRPLTIVGVAPPGFHGATVGARASVFVPISFRAVDTPTSIPNHDNRAYHWVHLFARLKPGVRPEEAAAAIDPLYRAIVSEEEAPLLSATAEAGSVEAFRAKSVVLESGSRGQSQLLAPIADRLRMLLAVAAVVLLLCCANVAGLMLVRGSARTGEMAVRAAMGATRGRLASLLLAESLLLAVPAALLSLPLALLILRGVAGGIPGLPRAAFDVEVSVLAAIVGVAVAVVAALGLGLYPVRDLARTDTARTLHAYGARQTSSRRVTRFRATLATAQVALSMALLAMTAVLAQSLGNIARVDLGLEVDSVVTFSLSPETSGHSPEASATLFDRLEQELAAMPGVISAASAMMALLSDNTLQTGVTVSGTEERVVTSINIASSDFFRTLGIGVAAGRAFTDADTAAAAPVAIINQRLAERLWPGENAIGRRIAGLGVTREVVGLVADAKYGSVTDEVEPQVFLPRRQSTTLGAVTFYVRSARPAQELMSAIRETVRRADSTVPITNLRAMQDQVRENTATERFVAGASTAFAVLATALAALGLYGVLAYSVAQRSREIALRFALGAPAARIRAMVLRQVGGMAVVGVAVGVVAAVLLGRAARSLLFGVEAADPLALLGAAVVLGAVMLGAAYVPARRASRVDPMTVLRHE